MANKVTNETKSAETKTAYNPMKDLVTVMLPRPTQKEENCIFVGLNGKGYTIMRGVPVRVPRPVAEIIDEAERQKQRQADFIAKQQERARTAAVNAGFLQG